MKTESKINILRQPVSFLVKNSDDLIKSAVINVISY